MDRSVIARAVREAAEARYGAFGGLMGKCHQVSIALYFLFCEHGFGADVVHGWRVSGRDKWAHFWVVSGPLIWDLTASQFETNDPIVTIPVSDRRYRKPSPNDLSFQLAQRHLERVLARRDDKCIEDALAIAQAARARGIRSDSVASEAS
jgi:hypothetical protein